MQFYFQETVEGVEEALALCSLYTPVDDSIREISKNALNVCSYGGRDQFVVLRVNSILSVVAMVPFGQQDGRSHRFFLVEKFALGVIDTGDIQD